MSTYVCSDIHGQYDLYARMFEEIQFSDNDHLYIIGDMIDRGPDGIRILQDAASRHNVTCLIGNHEHMMWDYINRRMFLQGNIWLHPSNGGRQTLSALQKLTPDEKKSVKEFLSELYLQVEITVEGTTFLLSHSSFLADRGTVRWQESGISKKDVSYVVWYSPWRYSEYVNPRKYREDGRYHVIGHVPVLMLDNEYWPDKHMPPMPCFYHDPANRIVNIDLGCAMMPVIKANPADYPEEFAKAPALCVLNLERFVKGEENPAAYIA